MTTPLPSRTLSASEQADVVREIESALRRPRPARVPLWAWVVLGGLALIGAAALVRAARGRP